jgi:hypothetical protein
MAIFVDPIVEGDQPERGVDVRLQTPSRQFPGD